MPAKTTSTSTKIKPAAAGTEKRSRTAVAEQRSTTFMIEPSKLVIVGYDTKHKKGEHPLWQERALEAVDENLGQNIATVGF